MIFTLVLYNVPSEDSIVRAVPRIRLSSKGEWKMSRTHSFSFFWENFLNLNKTRKKLYCSCAFFDRYYKKKRIVVLQFSSELNLIGMQFFFFFFPRLCFHYPLSNLVFARYANIPKNSNTNVRRINKFLFAKAILFFSFFRLTGSVD